MGKKKQPTRQQRPAKPSRPPEPDQRDIALTAYIAQANSQANRARVREYIQQCGSPVVAARGIYTAYAEAADAATTHGLSVACHAGCWFCCTIPVAVTVLEASLVFRALRMLPIADQERTWAQVDEHVAVQRQALQESRPQRVAFSRRCPLLTEDGRCSVYEARPLMCRGLLSTDAERCRRAFLDDDDGDPGQPFQMSVQAIDAGIPQLMVALDEGGMECFATYELASSLVALRDDPDLFLRWQQGQQFASDGFPHIAEHGDIFPTPANLPMPNRTPR